jgi:hypothetical protein
VGQKRLFSIAFKTGQKSFEGLGKAGCRFGALYQGTTLVVPKIDKVGPGF